MKNNLLKFISYSLLILLLFSCRAEDFDKQEADKTNSYNKFSVRKLTFEELQKESPNVAEKLKNLKHNHTNHLPTSTSKIYTDVNNGFFIDTDLVYYVEDSDGNKTYTFKIERNTQLRSDNSMQSLKTYKHEKHNKNSNINF